jgi:hypothetical protein
MAAWDRQREEGYHYAVFRDCISGVIGGFLESPASAGSSGRRKKRAGAQDRRATDLSAAGTETDGDGRGDGNDDLAEFVEVSSLRHVVPAHSKTEASTSPLNSSRRSRQRCKP